jgi:hypothetical protein
MSNIEIFIVDYDELSEEGKLCFDLTQKTYMDSTKALKLRDMYIDAGFFTLKTHHKIVVKEDRKLVVRMNRHFSLGNILILVSYTFFL